jgi:penicillin-binding protein 1A
VPAGIKLIRVDARSGMRASPGQTSGTILEAFKPGTAPPDNYSVIGVADADGRGGWGGGGGGENGYPQQQQQYDRGNSILRPGTGGLY